MYGCLLFLDIISRKITAYSGLPGSIQPAGRQYLLLRRRTISPKRKKLPENHFIYNISLHNTGF